MGHAASFENKLGHAFLCLHHFVKKHETSSEVEQQTIGV